ncbi:MAG: ribonuclease III [Bacteroidales bacterium]|nr:ribonuclease III [Bacteroidales bacterium]
MNMLRFFRIYFSKDKSLFLSIKNILGFYPGNVFLYRTAFTHSSVNRQSSGGHLINNERLEYLGDAVLSLVVADFLYKKYPLAGEGFLTEMRSKIVSRRTLNHIAHKMGLSELVWRQKGVANSFKSIDGDTLEALIGAIYIDKGYEFTKHIIIKRILQEYLDIHDVEKREWNYKSKLLNAMAKLRKTVSFNVVKTTGRGARKLYHVEVVIDKTVVGKGQDFSIKAAEQIAAGRAYEQLNLSDDS